MRLSSDSNDPKPKRPDAFLPNYFAKGMRLRLFLMAASLVGVLMLMDHARKPSTWQWMGLQDSNSISKGKNSSRVDSASATKSESTSKPIDNRFLQTPNEVDGDPDSLKIPKEPAEEDVTSQSPIEVKENTRESSSPSTDQPTAQLAIRSEVTLDDVEIAENDFWKKAYSPLDLREREGLFALTRAARTQLPLPARFESTWKPLLEKLDHQRQAYYAKILAAINDSRMSDEEQARWQIVLTKLQDSWDRSLFLSLNPSNPSSASTPQLPNASNSRNPLSIKEREEIDRLQQRLDQISLSYIRDSAINSRDHDMTAWFRIIEKLRTSPPFHRNAELPLVSFAQLFDQPDLYRGQPVMIEGRVRAGYIVDAPANDFGVKQYYVLWVKPHDGSQRLVAVYSLRVPTGFPSLKTTANDSESLRDEMASIEESSDASSISRNTATEEPPTDLTSVEKPSDADPLSVVKINEPVLIRGYFVKKWVYDSVSGGRVCPLLLTDEPDWQPPALRTTREVISLKSFLTVAMVVGLVSSFIIVLVVRRGIKPKPEATPLPDRLEMPTRFDLVEAANPRLRDED
jgi:hypothetical protein